MITAKQLEAELKVLNPNFTVVDSPNRPGLSNIFFEGKNFDLPVLSTNHIKDEVDQGHRYEFPNGMSARFWSKGEIMGRIESFLSNLETIKQDYE